MPVSEYFLYEKESIDDEYQQSGRELNTIIRPLAQELRIGSSWLHEYTASAAVKMTELFLVARKWETATRRFSSNSWSLRYRLDNFQFLRPQDPAQALTYSVHERMLMRVALLGSRSQGFRHKCCTLLSLLLPFVLSDNLCKYYE